MTLVIDASALTAWLMPDESGPDLVGLAEQHDVFAAPWLIWAEFRNILIVSERRGRLPDGWADSAVEAAEDLGIELDTTPSNAQVLTLARRHRLTVYDALYLDLALRRQANLATLDSALASAARAAGVRVA